VKYFIYALDLRATYCVISYIFLYKLIEKHDVPPGAWMSVVNVVCCEVEVCNGLILCPEESYGCVSCECCMLSARGLYNGLILRPEDSYG